MNIQAIREGLILEVTNGYHGQSGEKAQYASLCANKALEWLEINQDYVRVSVAAVNADKKTRKQKRKEYRATYNEVRAYVAANVDFAPQGFFTSTFFMFIAPIIINWVASKLMELLFGT